MVHVELDVAGRTLRLETGRVAKQADGSIWASYGDTVVLATYLDGCLVYSAMPGALWDERDLCIRERLRRY